MKKLLFIMMALMLVGCQQGTQENQSNQSSETTDINTVSSDKKTLVAYFTRVGNTDFPDGTDASSSASLIKDGDQFIGNTEYIANVIVDVTKGDKFLIQTQTKYSADYDELVDQQKEEKTKQSRPTLATHVENFSEYDVIYLGYPNWWYGMPMPVYSFLEEYDFSGKTIIPFNTSGGSGFSDTIAEIKKLCPNATVLDGYTTNGNGVENKHQEITEWLEKINK